jgi:integrase
MATSKKRTAKSSKKARTSLPGSIYLNKKRYWWKVQLPGETKAKARPLRPVGSKFATTDYNVAFEVATNIWQESIYKQSKDANIEIVNIASLSAAYLQHVDEYYCDNDNNPTSEAKHIRYSLKPLVDMFGCMPLEEFGPLKLIDLRDHMISLNWSRGVINQRVGRIKRMFKWGVCRQAVSPMVYHGLMAVEGLKQGRTAARETPKRRPANENNVYAVLPHTTPVIAAMIELQLLTGMRPGELVIMQPCDIDRNSEVWH